MALSRVERERVSDSRLKLQSVANTLSHIDPQKVPEFEDIQECLENAEKSLRGVLKSPDSPEKEK